MKNEIKGLFLITICLLFTLQPSPTSEGLIKSDSQFINVYYNTNTFKDGLFDENRLSLIPEDRIPETLIAWDLNGVVFENRMSTVPGNLRDFFTTNGYLKGITIFYILGKSFAYKNYLILNNDPRGHIWDAIFTSLETSIPGKETATLLRTFIQKTNYLNHATVDLLQELEEQGHINVVLSNMGKYMANTQIGLLEKQKAALPEDAPEHDHYDYILKFLTQPTNVIPSTENNWLHKPDYVCYQVCLELNTSKENPKRLTIFIDDKLSNVTAAVADGLFDIAIFFNGVDNLRTILKALTESYPQSTSVIPADQFNRDDFSLEVQ